MGENNIPFPEANVKMQERQKKVSVISCEIQNTLWEYVKSEQLTYSEIFRILSDVGGSFAKQAMKQEQESL